MMLCVLRIHCAKGPKRTPLHEVAGFRRCNGCPFPILTRCVLVCVVIVAVFGGRMTRTWRGIYSRGADFDVRLEENIGDIRAVQTFANDDHDAAFFAKDNAGSRKTKLAAYELMAGSSALNYMGMRLTQVVDMTWWPVLRSCFKGY